MIEAQLLHREKSQKHLDAVFDSIRKRDGRSVPFDGSKITNALTLAGKETKEFDGDEAKRLTVRVLSLTQVTLAGEEPSVEQIQDIVEEVLLSSPYRKTARAYIIYREQHARMREFLAQADVKLVDEYLEKLDWKVNENSNMTYSLQGLNNYLSAEISGVYWLEKVYPEKVRRAHTEGDLHIHDLNLLSVYCVGWDLRDLLLQGFRGAPGKIESGPPRHFRTALGQIVNFFYTLQGEAAGAQAFSNFDSYLAPFIRYDNLTDREIKQSLQEFVFNLNVPTRVGFQTPFTNLTLDLEVSPIMKDLPVIIGGEFKDETYAEFQDEMNRMNKALFEVLNEGDARGRVFTFPIPTVNIGPDFDWDNPVLNPLWESTAKYGLPYFANFVNSEMSPEDARSMCCRLRLDLRKLDRRGGGLFGANPLTGSVGVVTINLPRLGYLSKNEDEFFERLGPLMDLAKKSLEVKRKVLERFTDLNLYPYSKFYLRTIKEAHGSYWFNHFSTVGIVGMNEACQALLGKHIGTPEGKEFSLKAMDFMREKLSEFQQETGDFYNLEATPAEGAGFRLARLDAEKFETERQNYTNSTQLPVDYSDDIFEVLDHQDELQTKYTGGTVMHIFTGEAQSDIEAVKKFVRTVAHNYRLPYFTVTPTFSVCPDHGYRAGEFERCPTCNAKCEIYSRVVGYLRPVSQWNDGKAEEFKKRASYKVSQRLT